MICLCVVGLAAVCFPRHTAAQQTPAPEAATGIFKRDNGVSDWKKQVPGVDYSKDKDIKLKFGDVLATKEETVVFYFGSYTLMIMPYTVFRVNGIQGEEGSTAVPEVLFGEALFKGENGFVRLPGQNIQGSGVVYFTVDEEKYSLMAAIQGEVALLPDGAAEPIKMAEGDLLELGPEGETGEVEKLEPEDIAAYEEVEAPEDAPRVTILTNQENLTLEKLAEYWSKDRISLLQDGPESEVGLAIARGDVIKKEEEAGTAPVAVFEPGKGPSQKTLSFSSSVSVETSTTQAEGFELTSLTVAGLTATIGDVVNLKFKNLTDKTFKIAGRTKTDEPDKWSLFIKVDDEETQAENITNFERDVRVTQDFANAPSVFGVMIGDYAAQTFQEDSVLTRENLTSGKLPITGNAAAGNNINTYRVQLIGRRTGDDEDYSLGTFQVEVDLSELDRVEISTDDGIDWKSPQGLDDWTYSFSPMDGEKYKVRVRTYDVMGNESDEQFEPYTFLYRYKTDNEILRETFETMMRAFLDEDRSTFTRNTSENYGSNISDLRDYNELESSIQERFTCCRVNINYTITDVDANRDSRRGSVEFFWVDRSGVAKESNYAIFNYEFVDGAWKFVEVIDPNTFLRASRVAFFLEIDVSDTIVVADGEDTIDVTAHALDNAGSIVGDGVAVTFTTDNGTMNPPIAYTVNGYAYSTYIASISPGTAAITATSGSISDDKSITVNPVTPPLPPD